MSRKADCWDNAVAESFFATLKTELGDTFESFTDARALIREYIEDFYSCRRLHSSIGYVSPVHYELLNQTAARAA
jgi:putative transposase